jgi:hypothetical protein
MHWGHLRWAINAGLCLDSRGGHGSWHDGGYRGRGLNRHLLWHRYWRRDMLRLRRWARCVGWDGSLRRQGSLGNGLNWGIPGELSDVDRGQLLLPGLAQIKQCFLVDTALLKVDLGVLADVLDDLLEHRTHLLVRHDGDETGFGWSPGE